MPSSADLFRYPALDHPQLGELDVLVKQLYVAIGLLSRVGLVVVLFAFEHRQAPSLPRQSFSTSAAESPDISEI